jgi:glycosyltransferase involved in cell wall biosynthesis
MAKRDIDALVVTYKRPQELKRLITSLLQGSFVPRRIVVVDNSPTQDAADICRFFGEVCPHLPVGRNVGVGAGFNIGLRSLAEDPPEFVCALDDDCVMSREALKSLLKALTENDQVSFAAPLVSDGSANPAARPGLARKKDRIAFKTAGSWEALQRMHGSRLSWATGICLLYRYGDAIEAGLYREDFWALGEDVEFTLRLSKRSPGQLVGEEVAHIPPCRIVRSPSDDKMAYVKFLALITNLSYFATRLPHGHREIGSLPKLVGRFFLTGPTFPGAAKARDVAKALWLGAARGQPAGGAGFTRAFKARYIPEF